MSLHGDLLKQARQLAEREPKRPRQASLRRAVSSAYYALFHLCIDESTRLLIGTTPRRKAIRLTTRRAFVHGHMVEAARGFTGQIPPKLAHAMPGHAVQPELRDFAGAFIELQQACHEADYDLLRSFSKAETIDLVEQAEQAFRDWAVVKGTVQTDTFLVSLLVFRALR